MLLGRVVGPGEPLWTDEDRSDALAWHREQQAKCPQCGTPRDEADKYDVRHWTPRRHVCSPCRVIAHEQQHDRDSGQRDQAGVFYSVERED